MMRKFFYTLGIVAASALAFSACQKEQEVNNEPETTKLVTISFTAEKAGMETRTGIAVEGDSQVSYKWTDEDASNIKLFTVDGETLTQVANPTITKVSDDKLTISATVEANATYTFRAILAGEWDGNTPKLSADQTPNSTSKFDPTADILISDDKAVTVGAEGATGDMLLTFRRQVVVNRMTLKNLTAGEIISSVVINSNNNKELASGSTSLTVNYSDAVIPASGEFVVYFVTTPNTGVALTVAVTTDKNTYSKSFAEGKSIDFNLGQFTKFGVAMPQDTPKYYVKVTSTANLLNGVYLIVYEGGNVAFNGGLETLDGVSNTIAVSIDDNKIESNSTTDAAAFTISIDDGTILSKSGKYIGQTSDANGLVASQNVLTNNVSVDENEATITSSSGAHLRYNSASNQNRFRYFKSSTYSSQNAIALYLLEGSGTAPSNEALTVTPASTNPETVSYEGGVMNYTVTTGNIASWTATSDNEAFVVENVDGGFKVTVAANESSSPRTATITVAGGSKTETISITQDATPAPAADGDILWQEDFTGYGTTMPSSATGSHVYEGSTVTYTLINGGTTTKLFNEETAGGLAPELLVSKSEGSFKISKIPTGSAATATLTFKANHDRCTITPSSGVSVVDGQSSFTNKFKTVVLSISEGIKSFDLEIKNNTEDNVRVDDFMLIVGEPPAPTLSSIAVSGQTTSFTVGDAFDFGGTVTATYSNGATADVTSSALFSGYNMSETGSQTVTVSYTEDGVTVSCTFNITVNAASGTTTEVKFVPNDFNGQGTSGTGSSITKTKDGITFSCDKGYGTTQIRCYSGGNITVAAESGKTIKSISFTFSGSYTGGLETNYTLNNNTWTKSLSSQARIMSITVTY